MRRETTFPIRLLAMFAVGGVLLAVGAKDERKQVRLSFPAGDAERGRLVFISKSCASCHRVHGETGFPAPVSANPGPPLGPSLALQDPEQIGLSIVAPSHQIVEDLPSTREDGLSPMGDFSESMTVRELLDLVAYLGSLNGAARSPADGAARHPVDGGQ